MKKQIAAALLSLSLAAVSFPAYADAEYPVGIVLPGGSDTLSDLVSGFEDALLDEMGDQILFEEGYAENGETYTSLIERFLSGGDQMIFVSSDEMLAAAVSSAGSVPVVAAGIYDLSSTGNAAGVFAIAPYGEQTDLLLTILPEAQTVGLLYSEGNAFSERQVSGMQDALTGRGLNVSVYPFTDNLSSVLAEAGASCDVLYVPVDAGVKANAELIASFSTENRIPVITADEETCALCGLAVSSINPYELGYEAGELAADIIKGDDPSSIGMKSPSIRLRKYNEEIAAALGILPPEDFESIELFFIESEDDGIEEMSEEEIAAFEAELTE